VRIANGRLPDTHPASTPTSAKATTAEDHALDRDPMQFALLSNAYNVDARRRNEVVSTAIVVER